MKTRIKTILLLAMLALTFNGCEEPIDYRYADLPRPVECEGVDLALLHEALYSFQQDIGNAYNFRNFDPAEPLFVINGYRTFVHKGGLGEANYAEIASDHTWKVFEKLKGQPIWAKTEGYSHLDYHSPFLQCVLSNIQNRDIQETMASLNEINSMSPKLMAEPLRRNINDVTQDPYMAMYVALDFFYQYLWDVEPIKFSADE
jgi:hypothetical protein